jgi:cardiolipin synthase (CMP-forming)
VTVDSVRVDDSDRVLTLPNAVTLARLCLLPVFLWLMFHDRPRHWYAAAWVLGVMGGTDWVDGYLARHLHQVSTVGKVIDPIADRVLLLGGAGAILWVGAVPTWVAVLALGREAVVALTAVVLAALGAARIDVTWFGKAGTFGLMVALPLFLVGHSSAGWRGPAEALAWVAVVPGLVLGGYAAVTYVPVARRALAAGRAGRDLAVEVRP